MAEASDKFISVCKQSEMQASILADSIWEIFRYRSYIRNCINANSVCVCKTKIADLLLERIIDSDLSELT